MAELRWGVATHEGQVRPINEDHAFANGGLFVVADGMGGHLAGEVASEIAVNTLDTRLPVDDDNSLDDLVSAIDEANQAIYEDASNHADHAGMGTTITAIAVVDDPYDGEALGVANVGDSRIYLYRHNRLRQISVDHSFVQELVAEGAITREEARYHPRRNIVTRGLGIEPYVRVDSWTLPLVKGDRFVLCSDGLSDYVHDDDIAIIMVEHADDPQAAADRLVAAANEAGGADNITVVVLDVLEGDDPPDPTEELDIVPTWGAALDDTGESPMVLIDDPDADGIVGDLDEDAEPAEPVSELSAAAAANAETRGQELAAEAVGENATTDGIPNESPAPPKRRRAGRLVNFVLTVGVAGVLIGSFALFAAWARSGYYIDFGDDGEVHIYQGRPDGVLWFQPTVEADAAFTRDDLDATSLELVESRPEFSSLASAERYLADRLDREVPATTAPATTVPPTTSPATTNPSQDAPGTTRDRGPTTAPTGTQPPNTQGT